MTEEAPHLLVEDTGDGIMIAKLNRPDKLNAISRPMMDLLTEAVLRFRDTPELKVFLIRSEGRYFSAGADLRGGNQRIVSPTAGNSSARAIRENHRLNLNNMQQLWDEIEHIEKPFVVAHTCRVRRRRARAEPLVRFPASPPKARPMRFPKGCSGYCPPRTGCRGCRACADRTGRAG